MTGPYRVPAPPPGPSRPRRSVDRLGAQRRRLRRRLACRFLRRPRWVRCHYCGRQRRPWNARAIGYAPRPNPAPALVYACRSDHWHAPGCLPLRKATKACQDFGAATRQFGMNAGEVQPIPQPPPAKIWKREVTHGQG